MFENDHGNPCLSGALFHFLLFFVTGREAPTMVNEISAIAISTPGKRKKEEAITRTKRYWSNHCISNGSIPMMKKRKSVCI